MTDVMYVAALVLFFAFMYIFMNYKNNFVIYQKYDLFRFRNSRSQGILYA